MLKYLLYLIAYSIVWLVGEKLIGYQNTIVDWLPFTSLLWFLLSLVFLIRYLRERRAQRSAWGLGIAFKEALKLISAWLLSMIVVKSIYFLIINPDYFNDLLIRGREWLTLSAVSEENFQNSTRMMEDLLSLVPYLTVTTIIQFIGGLVLALIAALTVRNK